MPERFQVLSISEGGACGLSRDEQEIAGYAEAMDIVFQSNEDLSLAKLR